MSKSADNSQSVAVRDLPPGERRAAERALLVEKFAAVLSVCPNSIFVQFATLLGFTEYHFGLLALIGWVAQPVNWLASLASEHTGKRKAITIGGAAVGVLAALGLVLAAWWHPGPALAVPLLLGLTALGTAAGAVASVNLLPWIHDLAGAERWDSVLARRITISRLTLPLALLYGLLPDWGQSRGPAWLLGAIAVCFLLAAIFCVVRLGAFLAVPEPRAVWHDGDGSGKNSLAWVGKVFERLGRSRAIRRYLLFAFVLALGGGSVGTFLNVYLVNTLKLSQTKIVFASVILAAAATGAMASLYTRWKGRWTLRQLTCAGTAAQVVLTLAWIPALRYPNLFLLLMPLSAMAEILLVFGASTGILFQITPAHRRSVYLTAVGTLTTVLPALLLPLLGKWIALANARQLGWTVGGWTVVPIHLAMVIGAACYAVALLLAWKFLEVPHPAGRGVKEDVDNVVQM
jgi:hypothetical protein